MIFKIIFSLRSMFRMLYSHLIEIEKRKTQSEHKSIPVEAQ